MARLHHVTREQLLALRGRMKEPQASASSWKATRPDATDHGVAPWFSLTPRAPTHDARVGDHDAELSATLATFGGVTGPSPGARALVDGVQPPDVVLGGNPVAPNTPAGPVAARPRQCTIRLRISAEGLGSARQCLVLVAVVALGAGEHRVQSLLDERLLAEDVVSGEDRIALLLDVPDDGRLTVELWLRLAASDAGARLGVRGVQGHLL